MALYANGKKYAISYAKSADTSNFATKEDLTTKQDKIEDLEEIRSGASKGATAVQPDELNNYATKKELNAKQDKGDYALKSEIPDVSGKQDKITDLSEIRQGAEKGENALPSTTKYGSSLSLTINEQTYVLTAQLKDQNGDNLGTAQTVDLPLETMVVGAEYDEDTKELVLTLKNGQTVRFSIADLVSGLQPTLTEGAGIKLENNEITNTGLISATYDADKERITLVGG